jgi:xanthine dehydrogenase YagR molybdenum-binding subunit
VTLSAGAAVQAAARNLRGRFSEAGRKPSESYLEALHRLGLDQLAADGEWSPAHGSRYSIYSFGAVFAEVSVDRELPIPRVRRIVAAYDAGRIVNPKTARSQMTGGIVWGIGQALLERSDMDHRQGRFLNKNFAGYLIPSNADVPDIDVAFIDNFDAEAGPIGARGIGELGAIGIGPAIANAVFHATGRRVRSLPIGPEMLL